jgi:toxin ParE1/3/4
VNRRVRFSEPASDELGEAVRWYEARRPGLGGEFFDAVAATVSVIETDPEIGTTISPDGQTRRALVARFPYQVVYLLRRTEIAIVAIAHLKRRPRYWKDRRNPAVPLRSGE